MFAFGPGVFFLLFLFHKLAKSQRWHARPYASSPIQPLVVSGNRRVYLVPTVCLKWT